VGSDMIEFVASLGLQAHIYISGIALKLNERTKELIMIGVPAMCNKDKSMMAICILPETSQLFEGFDCDHPLDNAVRKSIKKIHDAIRDDDDDFEIFRHQAKMDDLWRLLISKAVKCLRYYDEREPFRKNAKKKPMAYGLDELYEYYTKYKKFECMLYGSNRYYRDHVAHLLRTWLLGVTCLVKNNGEYLSLISIRERKEEIVDLNPVEKLSMWTIIALTHDLGYPFEKPGKIVDTTRSMVSEFITNPDISMDLSFHGVQNYMNDFIVRHMSSKMISLGNNTNDEGGGELQYAARLQSKYYFKFLKSLEKTSHGILSTLIIYRHLTYFLESEYALDEDYKFTHEERRQFYIRREILRAIASHTCTDIYHLYMGSFAFFLIITDDAQEWGRKYISELYLPSDNRYVSGGIDLITSDGISSPHKCKLRGTLLVPREKGTAGIIAPLKRLREQALTYIRIFRGQDTIKRDFSFTQEFEILYTNPSECRSPCLAAVQSAAIQSDISFHINLTISNDDAPCLKGIMKYTADGVVNKIFGKLFFVDLCKEVGSPIQWRIFDASGASVEDEEASDSGSWQKGEFSIDLSN